MIKKNIFLLILISVIFANDFIIKNNSISIVIDDQEVEYPFFGGFNQPRIQWLDFDNDNDIDLFLKDEGNNLRYYENIGDSTEPHFNLISTNYMNIEIGNWFVFNDFDMDGDYDLMTQNSEFQFGSYTSIKYYQNLDMDFQLLAESLITDTGELVYSELVSTPTFSDIDGDGDLDFFSGNSSNGSLTYYENIGFNGSVPLYSYITNFWQDITIIGGLNQRHGASAINFIDLDDDSDLDLSWGDYFQQSLYIIWNIGDSTTPNMDISNIITEFPQNDPIETAGQNMPSFADLDGDDDNDLFVTVLFGAYGTQYVNNFYYYQNNGTISNPIYDYVTSDYLSTLDFYTDASPVFADIDNDADLDLFIGTEIDYSTFPFRGRIKYFKNIGDSNNPIFNMIDPYFLGTNIGTNLSPELVDIDNDGDNDMFVGEWNGKIKFFKNYGTPENFNFDYEGDFEAFNQENILEIIDLSGRSSPKFVDIDNDDDYDLFIGTVFGDIVYFENTGNLIDYEFTLKNNQYFQINVDKNAKPEFIDIDLDEDLDLLVGSESNGIFFYRNIGTVDSANYIEDDSYNFVNGHNISPETANLFNNEILDAFFGIGTGGLYHTQLNLCTLGDINNDHSIDVIDIYMIIDLITSENQDLFEFLCKADINYDDEINIFDIVLIVEIIITN